MIIWPRATLKLEITATTYYSIVFCIKHNICPHVQSLATLTTALFENNKFDIFFFIVPNWTQESMRNLIKFNSHSLSMRRCYLRSKLESFDVVRHKRGLGKINYGFHRSEFIYSFLFFLYRQLLPPFYDIRIFTYFRSMSYYRIINLAKLPLTKCHKIIMWKYNRNKVRLLREFFL